MRTPQIVLLLLLGLCGLSGISSAQSEVRRFRILTTVHPIEGVRFDDGGNTVELTIRKTLSVPYTTPDKPFDLYRMVEPPPGSPPGTEPRKQIIARVDIPRNMTDALVILMRGRGGRPQVLVYDDGVRSHEEGELKVINASRMPAALNMKKRTDTVGPGEEIIVPFESGPQRVKVAVRGGGGWKIAYEKGRIAHPGLRGYLIIFDYEPDPAISDIPPPPALVRFFVQGVPKS